MSNERRLTVRTAVLSVAVTGIMTIFFWSFTEESFISRHLNLIRIQILPAARERKSLALSNATDNNGNITILRTLQPLPTASSKATEAAVITKTTSAAATMAPSHMTTTQPTTSTRVSFSTSTTTSTTKNQQLSTTVTTVTATTSKPDDFFNRTLPPVVDFSHLFYMFQNPVPKKGLITVDYNPSMGLGNMLFIYATTLGNAFKYGLYPVMLNTPRFHMYNLMNLNVKEINGSGIQWTGLGEALCCAYVPESFKQLSNRNGNYRLSGYLQSYKYFGHLNHYFRLKEFVFKLEILLTATEKLANISRDYCGTKEQSPKNTRCLVVGIHVRRGDIASPSHQDYGYVLASRQYFLNAMDYLQRKHSSSKLVFVVIGNDFAWNKQNLEMNTTSSFTVALSKPSEAAVDLCFLSMCDHVIMSTGTYGWWAGYLSGGDVVYLKDYPRPKSYLASVTRNEDMFPPEWIGLA